MSKYDFIKTVMNPPSIVPLTIAIAISAFMCGFIFAIQPESSSAIATKELKPIEQLGEYNHTAYVKDECYIEVDANDAFGYRYYTQ
jgi:hypothetical protein